MKLPRVLVGVCTYEGKDYIWEHFKKAMESFSYPNYDVMIVDNSRSGKYAKKLRKESPKDWVIEKIPRPENTRIGHEQSLNKIRDYFLSSDYDYLLIVESDLLPPMDTIERKLSTGCSVIGSIYYIGHAKDPKRAPSPCLFKRVNNKTNILSAEEGWGMYGTGVRRIHGCGLGTTLVHRSIIERFPFKHYLGNPPKHADVLFFMDLENNGVPVHVDTDVIVPHFPSDWDYVEDI